MITILTVSTKGVPRNLANSSKKFGYNLNVLGIGKKWTGFIMKSELFLEELQKSSYKESDIFVLADGYDLIATGPSDELMKKYSEIRKKGYTMIAGCERFCYTPIICYTNASQNHPLEHKTHFNRYPNGGFAMGEKKALIEYVKYVLRKRKDEQYLLGLYASEHPSEVFLDTHANIIYNMRPEDGFDARKLVQYGKVKSPYSDTYVNFIHAPGVGNCKKHTRSFNYILASMLDEYDPISHDPVRKLKEFLKNYEKERNMIIIGTLCVLIISLIWKCTLPSGKYAPHIVIIGIVLGILMAILYSVFQCYYY